MLTPAEIHQFAERRYHEFLRAMVRKDSSFFPLELSRFGRAKTADGPALVRAAVTALHEGSKAVKGFGYVVEYRDVRSTNLGARQRLPIRVYFPDAAEFVAFIQKKPEIDAFERNLSATVTQVPALESWCASNVSLMLEYAPVWPQLLAVCEFFVRNPRPNLYVRELPVPVHTKFIEQHERPLRAMLNHLLLEHLDPTESDFCARFHLRDTEPHVWIRLLDPALRHELALPFDQFTLPISSIGSFRPHGASAVITENRLPLLTLPGYSRAFAVFGSGNAVGLLADAACLNDSRRIVYWGDIDLAGFQILSRFRAKVPSTISVLMDSVTLRQFEDHCSAYAPKNETSPEHLNPLESEACRHSIAARKRLEQERIPLAHAHRVIESVLAAPAA